MDEILMIHMLSLCFPQPINHEDLLLRLQRPSFAHCLLCRRTVCGSRTLVSSEQTGKHRSNRDAVVLTCCLNANERNSCVKESLRKKLVSTFSVAPLVRTVIKLNCHDNMRRPATAKNKIQVVFRHHVAKAFLPSIDRAGDQIGCPHFHCDNRISSDRLYERRIEGSFTSGEERAPRVVG